MKDLKIFEGIKPVVGVLQLLALPGAPNWEGRLYEVIARAEQEATAMATGGMNGILIENTMDHPYTAERVDSATAVAMGLITRRIMHFTQLPIGISVLKNDPETALAVAMNVGAKFIRVTLLTGAAMSESGILQGRFRELAEYKKRLQVEGIQVYADISRQRLMPLVGSPRSLKELALEAIEYGGADGVIFTDPQIDAYELRILTEELNQPVFYQYSGGISEVTPFIESADGLFVTTAIKKTFSVSQDQRPTVDLTKVEELAAMGEEVRARLAALI